MHRPHVHVRARALKNLTGDGESSLTMLEDVSIDGERTAFPVISAKAEFGGQDPTKITLVFYGKFTSEVVV